MPNSEPEASSAPYKRIGPEEASANWRRHKTRIRTVRAGATLAMLTIAVAMTDVSASNRAEDFLTASNPPLKSQPPLSRRAIGNLAGSTPTVSRPREDVYRFDGLVTHIDVLLRYGDHDHLYRVETTRSWNLAGCAVFGVIALLVLLWWMAPKLHGQPRPR